MKDSEMINEVEDKIVEIRGIPVIADADVAALYGVETRPVYAGNHSEWRSSPGSDISGTKLHHRKA